MSDNAVFVAPQMICNALSTVLDDVIAVVDTRRVAASPVFGGDPKAAAAVFRDSDLVTAKTNRQSLGGLAWQL